MAKYANEFIQCIVTGQLGSTEHHLRSQKTRPDLKDEPWNRLPICQALHNEAHFKGLLHMASKYPAIKAWLQMHNWYTCELTGKYRHD